MLCTAKFRLSFDSAIKANNNHRFSSAVRRQRFDLRLPDRHLPSLSIRSESTSAASDRSVSSPSSECYTSVVGFSPSLSLPLSQWNLTQRHILALNVTASLAAVSATCLFLSAIPALLAFKRAAESLEKFLDVTREELPGTMAAIRLSGMEISDLTMELSGLGQDVTQGVRSSTRAVRVAEERLRQLTNMAPSALAQVIPNPEIDTQGPSLARTARGMREGIVKGRAFFQIFFTLTRFSRMAFNYFSKQRAKRL